MRVKLLHEYLLSVAQSAVSWNRLEAKLEPYLQMMSKCSTKNMIPISTITQSENNSAWSQQNMNILLNIYYIYSS